jgi:Domain of unknown function (DUF4386)
VPNRVAARGVRRPPGLDPGRLRLLPGILAGVGNGLILGYLMYRTGLVPRRMALLGVIGGPLVALSGLAVLFGAYDQVSPVSGVATIPEFLWELSLGLYLTLKGFRPEAVARLDRPTG